MKDQILKGYVEDFKGSFDVDVSNESTVFEHFVNYCVISKQYPREFEYDDIHVGGADDIGLDGIAFVVNGNIVTSPEAIEYLLKQNGYLDVSLSFIQTKKSSSFKGDQVGTFIFGIKNFFDEHPSIPENEDIKRYRSIKDEVYRKSISLEKPPILNLIFATTGEWKEPSQITGRVSRELRELEEKHLFSEINFIFMDAEKLKQAYREINRKTIKEIKFSNHVVLPEIAGVRQSFIGSMPVKEYIDLITDSDNELQKNLFEDNVRDYQGSNKVNKDIRATILNSQEQAAMPIFNNGITIIAKKVEQVSNKIKLTDFQVVNGCQSSHVLFENKASLLEDTHIVVKLIETTDYDFATRVVKATNWQTEVKDEAFESLKQFHRDLEEYYKAKSKSVDNPIYYERRSKQYSWSPTVKSSQLVSLPTQINAYVAAELAQPQSTHRYYGELLDSNQSRMFKPGSKLEPYYISALLLKRIDQAFRRGSLDTKYKAFKYHLVYVCYQFYAKKMELASNYTHEDIISDIADREGSMRVFKAGLDIIRSTFKASQQNKADASRSKAFTDLIKKEMLRQFPPKNVTKPSTGRAKGARR